MAAVCGGKGSPEFSRLYDKISGTWAATIYSADIAPFAIKTGEFTTVTARRSLQRIVLPGQSTVDGGPLHFAPSHVYRFQWIGRKYSLTSSQAIIINTLLQAFGSEQNEVFEADLLKAIKMNTKYYDANATEPAKSIESHLNDGKQPAWTEPLTITGTAPEQRFVLKELR